MGHSHDDGLAPAEALHFFPDGSASGGNLAVSGEAGQHAIHVDWLTGEVTIATPGSEIAPAVSGRQSGFTLLEVVVALAILSLSLGTLVQVFGVSARNAVSIDQYSRTVLVAEVAARHGRRRRGPRQRHPGSDAAGIDGGARWEPYTEGRWSRRRVAHSSVSRQR
jgi:prepilin-type N-terminal cleavage/methylation domain-containing protein